ncbi:unnamed protein product [Ostreobium quekettii]|uniref:GHMP kinase N-terminal domain-containing protein n=1 Tax=Ostreobium quekettii TaxID=121088 RepID=A0A8S1J418_9CHLO|nr:unnamed protein product [Ostreobium quekettii]
MAPFEETVGVAHARTGLLGNPSDQYEGKVIAVSVANFHAEVRMVPSEQLEFHPHALHDTNCYCSMSEMVEAVQSKGYYGGVRLLKAICKRFYEYCRDHDIQLKEVNFRMSYSTNVPRQLGLAGSSAIVSAALSCLLSFYGIEDMMPLRDRPGLILSAEGELGITAGLMDRVVQVYGGCVFMDFNGDYVKQHGRGRYKSLPVDKLPRLWLVLSRTPSESGKVHSGAKQRWLDGDQEIRRVMAEAAGTAEMGRNALLDGDHKALGVAMNRNFDLRR